MPAASYRTLTWDAGRVIDQCVDRLAEPQRAEDLVDRMGTAASLAPKYSALGELELDGSSRRESQPAANLGRERDLPLRGHYTLHP
jgi:hypothetical protein